MQRAWLGAEKGGGPRPADGREETEESLEGTGV